MTDVLMPQLGETVTEGTITRWLKAVGEPVARDEPLFEVSTDKVDSEVPSIAAGVLAEILVPEGDTVPVGARLAVISAGDAAAPPPAPPAPPPPVLASVTTEAEVMESVPSDRAAPESSSKATTSLPAPGSGNEGLLLSPVVRRLIAENNLDPSSMTGTGPGGRITRDDVLAVVERTARSGQIPPTSIGATDEGFSAPDMLQGVSDRQSRKASEGDVATTRRADRDEIITFSNIRRRTAEHMVRSRQTSAHALAVMEVDFEAVDAVRRARGPSFREEEGFSLTYLPFVIVATVEALRHWPHLNSSVGDNALVVHHDIHIGIAVDMDNEGLIVPVIHNADTKRLRALARDVRDLAERARSKKLTADDVFGGTFTITNPGPFGTLFTAPIINQPQVAILSTDGVKRRPVAIELPDGTEGIAVHSVGNLALSFDHRVVDGAMASRFLRSMKEIVEGRDWDQEL